MPLLKSLLERDDEELKQAVVLALASLAQEPHIADQIDLGPFVHMLKNSDDARMGQARLAL